MATVGQQLATSEMGWKRYDDTSPEIRWEGQVVNTVGSTAKYKSTSTPLTAAQPKVTFDFIGEEIIIRSYGNYGRYRVVIDGIDEGQSAISGALSYEVTFIKENLKPGRHHVELHWIESTAYIDSIDIKNTSRLLHPSEVLDLKDLVVGKRIRCHYLATASQVGVFSGLGEETSDFIPPASSATPNGDFYFIMVEDWNGRKRLIADRNIQHSISWDALNSAGISHGLPLRIRTKEIIAETSTPVSSSSPFVLTLDKPLYIDELDIVRTNNLSDQTLAEIEVYDENNTNIASQATFALVGGTQNGATPASVKTGLTDGIRHLIHGMILLLRRVTMELSFLLIPL